VLKLILSNACVTKEASKSINVFKTLREAFNINNYNRDYSITSHDWSFEEDITDNS
jgi:hypothetical protein